MDENEATKVRELAQAVEDQCELKESAQRELVKVQAEKDSLKAYIEELKDSLKMSNEANERNVSMLSKAVKKRGEVELTLTMTEKDLLRSREFNRQQHKPLLEKIERLKANNDDLSREAGRLREENLQLNRYNNDLLVSERNLRAQIDELNANIDDREKRDITPTQMVAMMEAVFKRWSE